MNRLLLPFATGAALLSASAAAQLPSPALIGYWHNWNDANAPYLPLDAIDDRYNVVEVAFALPVSPTDMTLVFSPEGVSQSAFMAQMQALQSQGKKVLLSIGGATASIDLTTDENKAAFVSSLTGLVDSYGFDGIDIDIEHGNSILALGGTIGNPANIAQVHLIEAIEEAMAHHQALHGEKLLLTMAPETAYVQGGQSAFGNIWGGYLPIIDALRDSLDMLQVQLYNSGTMFGVDQIIYTQGTADFIVAMTDAVIEGFSTAGGEFQGLPASKVAVGLPACPSAAGGGYVEPNTVAAAVDYLLGLDGQPGAYALVDAAGHPELGGMMTWSINWDAASACGGTYAYADVFAGAFSGNTFAADGPRPVRPVAYPNPSSGAFTVVLPDGRANVTVTDALGRLVFQQAAVGGTVELDLAHAGTYFLQVASPAGTTTQPLLVAR